MDCALAGAEWHRGRPLNRIVSHHVTTTAANTSRTRVAVEGVGLFVISATLAVLAIAALYFVENMLNWRDPFAPGTGGIVLMLFGLVCYHAVASIGLRLHLIQTFNQFGLWPHVAYIGGALGTFLFTFIAHFMWLGLLGGLVAVGLRFKGRPIQPMGIAVVGLIVSAIEVAYWVYLKWAFSSLGAT